MERRNFLKAGAAALGALAIPAARADEAVAAPEEEALLPDLPIVDCHHHLYEFPATDKGPGRHFLFQDLLAEIKRSGHNIVSTMAVEDYAMYRADGPVALRSLGETEFLDGIAAMSASGLYGPCRINAGIVAFADLRLGPELKDVLEAHIAVGGGRLRGIRNASAWDPFPIFGRPLDISRRDLLRDPNLRAGVAALAPLNLVFDAFVFHPQIPEVTDLARAVPGTTIVLDHLGTPLGIGPYAGKRAEIFKQWKASMKELARNPNVMVKLGGLGMGMLGFPEAGRTPQAPSAELAAEWRPLIETSIELFGPDRCMFESNYPPDGETASYRVIWNTFKRITASASDDERAALFGGTAKRVYRLPSA